MSIPLLLQPQSIAALYQKFADETPNALLQFFPDRANAEAGLGIQYDTIEYGKDVAAVNARGGLPQMVTPAKRGTVVGHAITLSEQIYIGPDIIKSMRAPGSITTGPAAEHIAREIKQLRLRIQKRKALFAAQCLGTASGNLSFTLPGAASAETVSLNYQTSPNNHTAIGSAWQTAATDVIANILTAKTNIAADSGKLATHMVMNSTTGAYLGANTKIASYLSDVAKDEMRLNGRLSRLCDLDIIYVDDTYVVESTGTATKFLPDNHVAILAGDSSDRGMLECAPQSIHAPEGTRGIYFHTFMEPGINGGVYIQYEYNVFPYLACPDEIVFDTTVAA